MKYTRSQQSLEYLSTYIWAVLIISVVLVSLYALGILNPQGITPKALPGSCSVQKISSQGSVKSALTGLCNGALPEFVTVFDGPSSVTIPNAVTASKSGQATITGWIYFTSFTSSQAQILLTNPGCSGACGVSLAVTNTLKLGQSGGSSISCFTPQLNMWYYIAINISNSNNAILYVNGTKWCTLPAAFPPANGLLLGRPSAGTNSMQGYMSNFQFYNTSLPLADIQIMYDSGLGGVPIDLNNLVGWWPLNGNYTDYSGNGNNGQQASATQLSGYPYAQPGYIKIVGSPVIQSSLSSSTLTSQSTTLISLSSSTTTVPNACGANGGCLYGTCGSGGACEIINPNTGNSCGVQYGCLYTVSSSTSTGLTSASTTIWCGTIIAPGCTEEGNGQCQTPGDTCVESGECTHLGSPGPNYVCEPS